MLKPCGACHRHIDDTEPACPFCGREANDGPARRPPVLEGRLSRAAVFASALVAPACYVSDPPPPQYVRQPPPDDRQPPPPPPDDPEARDYARPPDDRPPPPSADASVAGVLRAAETGAPLAGVRVELRGGRQPVVVVTDDRGEFVFAGVLPGRYIVATSAGMGTVRNVLLRSRTPVHVDLSVQMQPVRRDYDRTNIPKPYGAPPARRRVV